MFKLAIRLLALVSPWLWPIRIPVAFTPGTATMSIVDARTGKDPTEYTYEECFAWLTLTWDGGRANEALIEAVWDQDPRYRVPLLARVSSSRHIPVTMTSDGKAQAEVTLVTGIGIYSPGDYRLEGSSYSFWRSPWLGNVGREVNTLTSAPFELPRDPEDRCSG